MVSYHFQWQRQTPPIILSGFENPDNGKHKNGYTAKEKLELKLIKSRADDPKVPILLWNEH